MKSLIALLLTVLTTATAFAFVPDPDTTPQDTLYRITLNDGSELIGRIESQDSTTVQFLTVDGKRSRIPRSFIRSSETASQDAPFRITLKDGSELVGRIESQDSTAIRFVTISGVKTEIGRILIESIERLDGIIEGGQYRRIDPNRTRLFIGPTAHPLRAGEGYFSVYEIFFPFFAVGVGDVFSLAGGLTLFPGATEQAFYFAPRIFVPLGIENLDLAAGLLYGTVPGEEGAEGGIFYGVATFGSPFVSLTTGLGYGFSGEDVAQDPIILLGFEAQVSNSVKFISENWIVVNAEVVPVSFGIRFFGDHLAADFALLYPLGAEDIEGFPFIPWIGFTYNFGR